MCRCKDCDKQANLDEENNDNLPENNDSKDKDTDRN